MNVLLFRWIIKLKALVPHSPTQMKYQIQQTPTVMVCTVLSKAVYNILQRLEQYIYNYTNSDLEKAL